MTPPPPHPRLMHAPHIITGPRVVTRRNNLVTRAVVMNFLLFSKYNLNIPEWAERTCIFPKREERENNILNL